MRQFRQAMSRSHRRVLWLATHEVSLDKQYAVLNEAVMQALDHNDRYWFS